MNHCLSSTLRDMRWKKLILVEVTVVLTSDTERSQENRSKNDKYKAGLVFPHQLSIGSRLIGAGFLL